MKASECSKMNSESLQASAEMRKDKTIWKNFLWVLSERILQKEAGGFFFLRGLCHFSDERNNSFAEYMLTDEAIHSISYRKNTVLTFKIFFLQSTHFSPVAPKPLCIGLCPQCLNSGCFFPFCTPTHHPLFIPVHKVKPRFVNFDTSLQCDLFRWATTVTLPHQYCSWIHFTLSNSFSYTSVELKMSCNVLIIMLAASQY